MPMYIQQRWQLRFSNQHVYRFLHEAVNEHLHGKELFRRAELPEPKLPESNVPELNDTNLKVPKSVSSERGFREISRITEEPLSK